MRNCVYTYIHVCVCMYNTPPYILIRMLRTCVCMHLCKINMISLLLRVSVNGKDFMQVSVIKVTFITLYIKARL